MVLAPSLPAASLDRLAAALGRGRVGREVALAPYTTFRIGGPADLLYRATSADELAGAVAAARAADVPSFVLGLGANVLVGDRGVRGLVIRNESRQVTFHNDGRVDAESGVVMGELIHAAVARGWSGIEHYIGIPSTVGGAVWQNLHFLSPAPARERTMFIAEVTETVDLLGADGRRRTVDRAGMQFGYDTSLLHNGQDIALSVRLRLARGDQATMHRILQENLGWRGSRHPWLEHHPSAGSIFKKIEGVGAGRLVDQCGLKGYRVGDAQVSHLHANIFVNLGQATAADVRELIRVAQAAVLEKFGQRLEPEIGFVGEF
ncbi:MAG: UDP-N-acetylmuramate dehydrogenase [Gemmatimonadetes bacterium]|nr:UDP-N-acetylmuramate dehydrogenase [Gemmatimonadota bacterium]